MDDGVLDINGWDIRKALRLLRKGNAALREWLHSPIIYQSRDELFAPVLELAQRTFWPETLCHHYLALARRSLATLKESQQAKRKTYLYALRPLLCCQWIIHDNTQPPMLIDELLAACMPEGDPVLREYIDELLRRKRQSEERAMIERSEFFEVFLRRQINALEPQIPKNPPKIATAEFDRVFKAILKRSGTERASACLS